MQPTSDQITGALRTILAGAGGYAVAKGWIDAGTATSIAGALAILIVGGWSWAAHSKAAMIQSVNSADNGVTVVPTAAAISAGIPAANAPVKP